MYCIGCASSRGCRRAECLRSAHGIFAVYEAQRFHPINGGVYRGLDTTVRDFFPFLADFDEFYAKGDEYFESGDHVIVLGHYLGVSKKGRRVQSRFAHFWTIRDGKVGRLQQTADTLLIAQALGK